MRAPVLLFWSVMFSGTGAARTTWAQAPETAPSGAATTGQEARDPIKERVTALYNTGVAAAKVKDWHKAKDAFAEAWSLKPHYQIAANLGRAEYNLRQYRDAAEHLSLFLREAPTTISPEERALAQEMQTAAVKHVGTLTISANVVGADILVDGSSVGRSQLTTPIYVEPGNHTLEARHKGYLPARKSVDVAEGVSSTTQLRLELPPELPSHSSTTPSRTPSIAVMIAGGVLVLGAAGVGAGYTYSAANFLNDRDSKVPDQCVTKDKTYAMCKSEYDAAEDSRLASAKVAVGSFIGAGALTVATAAITYALWPSSARPSTKPTAAIVFSPGMTGTIVQFPW